MMKNSGLLRVTGVIALVVIIGLITILISSSLSVGGTAFSSDSETCSSCHIEVPYVEGYRNSPHSNGNLTCMSCHQYSSPIKDKDCLTCHEDDYITNSTAFFWDWVGFLTIIDAHTETPHISSRCTGCHLEHKFQLGVPKVATQSRCFDCHPPIPEGVNIDRMPRAPQ
jgi:hypothetical protein